MVHKILFWSCFGRRTLHTYKKVLIVSGIATRLAQLGVEMRPFFQRQNLWAYPLFAGVGGSFGWWLQGVESRQMKMLQQRKEMVIEKRRRRDEREGVETAGTLAATS